MKNNNNNDIIIIKQDLTASRRGRDKRGRRRGVRTGWRPATSHLVLITYTKYNNNNNNDNNT